MAIKKGNKRIMITMDQKHLEKLEFIKKCLGTKNSQKALYLLLDLYCQNEQLLI